MKLGTCSFCSQKVSKLKKHLCVASSSNIRRALAVQGSCNTVHVDMGTWPIHTATAVLDLGLLLAEFATVTSWSRSSKISNLKLLVFSCTAFRNKLEKLLCFEARSASRWYATCSNFLSDEEPRPFETPKVVRTSYAYGNKNKQNPAQKWENARMYFKVLRAPKKGKQTKILVAPSPQVSDFLYRQSSCPSNPPALPRCHFGTPQGYGEMCISMEVMAIHALFFLEILGLLVMKETLIEASKFKLWHRWKLRESYPCPLLEGWDDE